MLNPYYSIRADTFKEVLFFMFFTRDDFFYRRFFAVVFACLRCDQVLKCLVVSVKVNRYDWFKNPTRAGPDPAE